MSGCGLPRSSMKNFAVSRYLRLPVTRNSFTSADFDLLVPGHGVPPGGPKVAATRSAFLIATSSSVCLPVDWKCATAAS